MEIVTQRTLSEDKRIQVDEPEDEEALNCLFSNLMEILRAFRFVVPKPNAVRCSTTQNKNKLKVE